MNPIRHKPTRVDWTPIFQYLDEQGVTQFIQTNRFNIILFLGLAFMVWKQQSARMKAAKEAGANKEWLDNPDFPEIKRPENFSWKDEEPFKLRPFKPKYHLTMALEKLDPTDLILIDKNHADRLAYRKKIMNEHPDIAIGVNDKERIGGAVREMYSYLMATYLPHRYPDVFKLHLAHFDGGKQFMLENKITKAMYPATASFRSEPETLLRSLGNTLDEEFLLMLPQAKGREEDKKYVLEAYVNCSPSGFNTREKLGKILSAIHEPVPAYAEKLEGSMDRYFANLGVGKYVKRANWTITLHDELFLPGDGTNHLKEDAVVEELESIDPEKTFLRCERQTLHRLPRSRALVFAFKTYLTPLKQIKDEGLGEELAEAIDGMKNGSVPAMHYYKRGVQWGPAVQRYLRS